MSDKNLRRYGLFAAIISGLIWFYAHDYWIFSILIAFPAIVLLVKNNDLSTMISKSLPNNFSSSSILRFTNPFFNSLKNGVSGFENIHLRAAIIVFVYGVFIVLIFTIIFVVAIIAYALIASKNNISGSGTGGKRPNVIFSDSNVVVGSMRQLSMGRWEVRYGSRSRPTEYSMTISPNTSGSTAGGGCRITWH